MVYPDGEILSYAYDTGGQLKSVTGVKGTEEYNYVKSITYDAFGQRTKIALGNGDVSTYTYDKATRRLMNLQTKNGSTTWQDLSYTYDNEGNIKTINNKDFITKDEDARTSSQKFSYDELDRLTEASGTYSKETWLPYFTSRTNSYTNEINYDEIGNITRKEQVNTGTYDNDETKNLKDTTYAWDYAYGSARPHAVTKTGDLSYTYDANGNMTYKENSSTKEYLKFTWDDENRLTKTEDNLYSTTYRYDDTGTRIAKKGKFGETIYASDIFTVKNGTIESTHIFAGQTRIATKVQNTSKGTTSTTPKDMGVYYYHPDHLGSSSTVTNEKGKFTEHNEYFPYGEIWVNETNSDTTLPYKFTSKELDSEMGLYYYGARYMDPKLGRFVSIDPPLVKGDYFPTGDNEKDSKLPGMGGVFNSVNLNAYQYAGNNPIRYIDPDGNFLDESLQKELITLMQKAAPKVTPSWGLGPVSVILPLLELKGEKGPAGGVAEEVSRKCNFVVIGENMPERVIPTANAIGAKYYKARPIKDYNDAKHKAISLQRNRDWLIKQIRSGAQFFDVGRDENNAPSDWYKMEKETINEYRKKGYDIKVLDISKMVPPGTPKKK